MKKNKLTTLFAALSILVVGCNNHVTSTESTNGTSNGNVSNSSNVTSSVTPQLPEDYKVSSYYEAMNILKDLRNYTLKVTYMEGSYEMKNNVYFTEKAIFDDYIGDEYGYILTDKGVVKVNYYEDELIASEVIKKEDGTNYDTVWDKTFFTSFANINVEEFKDAGNGEFFDITGKANKINFMNLVYAQQTDYEKLIAVTAYLGENLSEMFFTLEFDGGFGYTIELANINTTKIQVVDEFLAAGNGPTEIAADLMRVKELFSGFNYKRVIYYLDEAGNQQVAGYEYFNPDYFFAKFVDEYKIIDPAVAFDAGYIGFNHKIVEGVERHGAYYAYIVDGNVSIFPQVAYHDPDITKFYNYPTYMTLFENLQYFTLVEGSEHSYTTTNFDLSLDFIDNMQIRESLEGLRIDSLTITLEDDIDDEYAKVIFTLEYSDPSSPEYRGTADFEFLEFGMANILEFDRILEAAEDAR